MGHGPPRAIGRCIRPAPARPRFAGVCSDAANRHHRLLWSWPAVGPDVRQTLTFKEGDSISFAGNARPAFLVEAERRLAALPGVIRASVNPVCCDAGRVIVYVGLEQQGQPVTRFRDNPTGTVRLQADVLQAARDLEEAQKTAVVRGDVGEDDSRGHTLMHDAAARAIQERFVGYAARDLKALTRVLRESSDAGQRAIAAEVLGYAPVKQDVVPDLVSACRTARRMSATTPCARSSCSP